MVQTPGLVGEKTVNTVSQLLKREREARGITLEEVAQKTYIKLHYLHALEEDRPDLLPAPVYTCGYIRQYAKLLGLDGAELVNLYQQHSKAQEYTIVRTVGTEEGQIVEEGIEEPVPQPVAQPQVRTQPVAHEAVVKEPAMEIRIESPDALLSHPEAEKILALARQQGEEIIEKARLEAQRLRTGAEQYAEQVLMQLEQDISRTLAVIKNGRSYLQSRQRRKGHDRPPERLPEQP